VIGRTDGGVLIEFDDHPPADDRGLLELRVGTPDGVFWVVARVEPAGSTRVLVRAAQTSRRAEDRSFPRLALITAADVVRRFHTARHFEALTVDVSAEGVGLFGLALETGDEVDVHLVVPDSELVIAVASWAVVVRRGVGAAGQPFAGLHFVTLDVRTRQQLLSLGRRGPPFVVDGEGPDRV
jgi:hypothetical protein